MHRCRNPERRAGEASESDSEILPDQWEILRERLAPVSRSGTTSIQTEKAGISVKGEEDRRKYFAVLPSYLNALSFLDLTSERTSNLGGGCNGRRYKSRELRILRRDVLIARDCSYRNR